MRELSERLILSEEICWNLCLHFIEMVSNNLKKNPLKRKEGICPHLCFLPGELALFSGSFSFLSEYLVTGGVCQ